MFRYDWTGAEKVSCRVFGRTTLVFDVYDEAVNIERAKTPRRRRRENANFVTPEVNRTRYESFRTIS